eukprot:43558-Pyramimonas_sp.AAC.2
MARAMGSSRKYVNRSQLYIQSHTTDGVHLVVQEATDFGGGGSYPEIHVLQYPCDMGRETQGPGGLPLSLDTDYDVIIREVGQRMLREPVSTPEYSSFCTFHHRHHADVLAAFPERIR